MSKKVEKQVDDETWKKIESEYRFGSMTLRSISRCYCVGYYKIRHRVRSRGWIREGNPLGLDMVKAVSGDPGGSPDLPVDLAREGGSSTNDMMTAAVRDACRQVAAIRDHSALIRKGRAAVDAGLSLVESAAVKADIKTYAAANRDLAAAGQKWIQLERTALGMDRDDHTDPNRPLNITINLRRGQDQDNTVNITPGKRRNEGIEPETENEGATKKQEPGEKPLL